MFTKCWKVYGKDGHRQRESFCRSRICDIGSDHLMEVINSDITGTHDYSIVRITLETETECDTAMFVQICDGLFENSRVGRIEVTDNPENIELPIAILEAYYLPSLPDQIAAILPDYDIKIFRMFPFRHIKYYDLHDPVSKDLCIREMLIHGDKVPRYIWSQYGFVKEGE